MKCKKIKIFIPEEIPSGNKGEVAILKGIKESLISLGFRPDISVLSPFYPDKDQEEYGNEFRVIDGCKSLHIPYGLTEKDISTKIFMSYWCLIQHILFTVLYLFFRKKSTKLMKSEIWKEYVKADILLLGHDNLFANPFGSSLFFMNSYQILMARVIGKPCVILGASIGPFRYRFLEYIFKFILKKANIILLREIYSYEYAKVIGIEEKNMMLATDPAVLLKASPMDRIEEIKQKEGIDLKKPCIALMTSSFLFRHINYPTMNLEERYWKHVSQISSSIDKVINDLQVEFIFMYHATFPSDDRDVMRDIFRTLSRKDSVKIIENDYSVEDLKGLIGSCDLFIGERTHSLISAVTMCVPCIAISHKDNFKTDGIIGELFGLQDRIIFIEEFEEKAFVQLIKHTWETRKKIHNDLEEALSIAKVYANRNAKAIERILNS